jgi:3'-phosphoadenosine 5'-phosphosulfate sulfotransferase (PAPS reductase)/FAD synthetase
MRKYHLNHLRALESEAIYVIREVAAQFERPVLLFSGGKDSICMAHLARKAFHPGKLPFPLMHVDTGHNFPETIEYRDRFVADMGAQAHRCPCSGLHRFRAGHRGNRTLCQPQLPADRHPAGRGEGAQIRCRHGRGPKG